MSLNILILDLETTGLDSTKNTILEIAAIPVVLTNNIIKQSSCIFNDVVKHPQNTVYNMDKYCFEMHNKSGLISDLSKAESSLREVECALIDFIVSEFSSVYKRKEPLYLCGNSIHFDRGFINFHMPDFAKFLHYRMIDVTSYTLIRNEINTQVNFRTEAKHRALADAQYSLSLLQNMVEIVTKGIRV